MKNSLIKRILVFFITIVFFTGLFQDIFNEKVEAATKPGKPSITVKAGDDGKSAIITIEKTKNAQGYQIAVKKPGSSKYVNIMTLKKDGTAKRTYTATGLGKGKYSFRVRAYRTIGKKTYWSKYSKVASVKLTGKKTDSSNKNNNNGKNNKNLIHYEAYDKDSYYYVEYETIVKVEIDTKTMDAEVTFKRNILDNTIERLNPSTDEDRKKLEKCRRIIKENYASMTCKAQPYMESNNALYDYRLKNFKWSGDKTMFFGVSSELCDYDEIIVNSNKTDRTGLFITGWLCKKGQEVDRISFYPTEEGLDYPDDDIYTILRDNYGFENTGKDFFGEDLAKYAAPKLIGKQWYDNNTVGFLLDDKTYNSLMKGRSNSEKASIMSKLSKKWAGSCMGMSITNGLLFNGKLKKSSFANKNTEVYDYDPPYKNEALLSAIQYYQIKGNLESMFNIKLHQYLNRSDSLMKKLVKAMLSEENPLYVVSFDFDTYVFDSKNRSLHAMLAYKIEKLDSNLNKDKYRYENDFRYRMYLYDPNYSDSPFVWYVKEDGDFESDGFDPYWDYYKPSLISFEKPEYYLDSEFKLPELDKNQICITFETGTAEVKIGDKKMYVDGNSVSGTLSSHVYTDSDSGLVTAYIDDITPGQEMEFYNRGKKTGSTITVQTADNFYLATSEKSITLKIGSDGSAKLSPASSVPATLGIASDKNKADLFCTSATATCKGMSMIPTANGVKLTVEGSDKVDVTLSGVNSKAEMNNVNAAQGELIIESGDEKATVSDINGNKLAEENVEGVEPEDSKTQTDKTDSDKNVSDNNQDNNSNKNNDNNNNSKDNNDNNDNNNNDNNNSNNNNNNDETDPTTFKVFDEVNFGSYEQDGNTKNGKEPIEWIILEDKGDTVVLLSKYILDQQAPENFDDKTSFSWKDSSIRKWLNNDFLKEAFTENEISNLVQRECKPDKNAIKSICLSGGETVKDRVSLLSLEELLTYFSGTDLYNEGKDICCPRLVTIPTKAIAYSSTNIDGLKTNASHSFDRSLLEKINYPEDILNGAYSEWWLRSAGDTYRYGIVYVKTHGKISAWSSYVGLFKEKGIRPVIEVSKKILR